LIIEGRIVNAWDALGADQVVNVARDEAKLMPHVLFFLHLGHGQLLLVLVVQIRSCPLSALGALLHIPLSSIEVMQMPSTPPATESSLDDNCGLMKELRLKQPLPLEPQGASSSSSGPATYSTLDQKCTAHHCMPTPANF